MSQCGCVTEGGCGELPREVVDIKTPLYEAVGGRLYRLHILQLASAILMGDGMDVETRIRLLERNIARNATSYFASNLEQRDELKALVPGDICYVRDASADPVIVCGSATYLWLPTRKWKLLYHGLSPLELENFIKRGGGLAIEKNHPHGKAYVVPGELLEAGGGLELGENGKLAVDLQWLLAQAGELAKVLANADGGLVVGPDGKLAIDLVWLAAQLARPGGGLAAGSDGKLTVVPGDLLAADGGLVPGAGGKLAVDLQWLLARVGEIVKALANPGGGLVVGPDGKLTVDFNSMPTDKFDALLKSLRLPIWLTGNMDVYVDKSHANASDNLEDGRGTADKPFRSIQACVNYVCENYNIGDFLLTIHVAAGTYYEDVYLKEYTRSGGVCLLLGAGKDQTIISQDVRNNSDIEHWYYCLNVNGSPWSIKNLTLDISASGNFPVQTTMIGLGHYGALTTSIENVKIYASVNNNTTCYLLDIAEGGLNIDDGCEFLIRGYGVTAHNNTYSLAFFARGGKITAEWHDGNINAGGTYDYFAQASGGDIIVHPTRNTCFPANSVQGKRYVANNGGRIDVQGKGPNFFPGNADGEVESSTYSWYK